MRKKVLTICFSITVIVALTAVVITIFSKPSKEELSAAEEQIETTFYSEIPEEDTELFSEDMSEYQMQQIIHAMSHQKVKADQKWGKILITQKSVSLLLSALKKNEGSWKHSATYADILNRWYEEDFSKADKDHNAVWVMLDGNIGKAKGVLNAVEEQKYLDEGK